MTDPINTFREEAAEHLAALEEALLELEECPQAEHQIAAAFRAMHTIKGSAGMVGFDHLSQFTHHLETLFDRVRNGEQSLDADLCQLVLQAGDHISALLESPQPTNTQQQVSEQLLVRILGYLEGEAATETAEDSVAAVAADEVFADFRDIHIAIRPHVDSFRDGFDLLPVVRELQGLGECSVEGVFAESYAPDTFDPESCYLQFSVRLRTARPQSDIDDAFMFVADDWQIDIHTAEAAVSGNVAKALSAETSATRVVEEAVELPPETAVKTTAKKVGPQRDEQPIKVPQYKLDSLMDQVGELVILQASLDQLALERNDERLDHLAEELDRLANSLRDITFDIRMLPIGSTFSRFRRLVRDLSHELGKQVTLETEGADTELDKVVLDKLVDPLVHILRNSLDHGIEKPDVRRAKGKPEKGVLKLSASHVQGQIQIEIRDDGAGLDRDRILQKAIDRELIAANASLEDKEIFQLIFEPGFSTAAQVSDISGRGVGMDVVRSSIEALQGKVHLYSETGQGTCLRILLPMTLSIIDGLMVAVADQMFVIPLSQVEECIETSSNEPSNADGTRLIRHREQLLPSLRLRENFYIEGSPPDIEQTVIVNTSEIQLGLTVDEVIGNHQTVIRSLGRLYNDTPGVMGATILGDGGIAMILDLTALAACSSQAGGTQELTH